MAPYAYELGVLEERLLVSSEELSALLLGGLCLYGSCAAFSKSSLTEGPEQGRSEFW